ncbi:MAG: lipid-binding SYLF domain-containing protein [Alphaproteobacteria bacterium]|jgi:lipid-binding SYLF domain-containing protein
MTIARLLGLLLLAAMTVTQPAKANDTLDQDEMLSNAGFVLQRLVQSKQLPTARALLKQARAVMIFPDLIKGALIFGGEGGSGVLLVRNSDNSWSYPAFYSLGSFSFGLQFGGQSSEAVLLIMNEKALNALMEDQVKLGGDLSAAVGPVGSGIEASATTSLGEDIYTYSTTKGLFIGASLEGAVIARREDWNGAYYNGTVAPKVIVLENSVSNPNADPLRALLKQHASN